ncbi:hypothetical protein D8682_00675 (plasmid) [Buttiauxella sp. 3AFRM03]|uniref:hypothetical protein n=1 Tax=Buttiauxella sp. 3AFRM03 TaxID=2479367 RepID=UPI000EF83CE2|nr:hypothetical protein [Buttiauxella sp. 3AFRM03]AYN25623.1 hypothetical protein D8682_00675 [Buttiauxella sp. 3AFRM03]
MSTSLRNTLILACIFSVIILAFDHLVSGKSDEQTASSMRVDVWNCQDEHSHANYKVLVKSNNGGADNVMLRNEAGDIRCSK